MPNLVRLGKDSIIRDESERPSHHMKQGALAQPIKLVSRETKDIKIKKDYIESALHSV